MVPTENKPTAKQKTQRHMITIMKKAMTAALFE